MSASALRPKTNMRRLMYFIGISLVIHILLTLGTSIDYLFGKKPLPAAAQAEASAPAPAAAPPAAPGSEPVTSTSTPADKTGAKPGDKPATKTAEKKSTKDSALPAAPSKPKDADAEYNKRQKPATEQEKKQAESIRPDLDALK